MMKYVQVKLDMPKILEGNQIQLLVNAKTDSEARYKVCQMMKDNGIHGDLTITDIDMNEFDIVVLSNIDSCMTATLPRESTQDSRKYALNTRLPFGKFKDKTLGELMEGSGINYLYWLLTEQSAKGLLRRSLDTLENEIKERYREYKSENTDTEELLATY